MVQGQKVRRVRVVHFPELVELQQMHLVNQQLPLGHTDGILVQHHSDKKIEQEKLHHEYVGHEERNGCAALAASFARVALPHLVHDSRPGLACGAANQQEHGAVEGGKVGVGCKQALRVLVVLSPIERHSHHRVHKGPDANHHQHAASLHQRRQHGLDEHAHSGHGAQQTGGAQHSQDTHPAQHGNVARTQRQSHVGHHGGDHNQEAVETVPGRVKVVVQPEAEHLEQRLRDVEVGAGVHHRFQRAQVVLGSVEVLDAHHKHVQKHYS
mmetsp:Transcript_45393/g.86799  ORF Transcript_45393/g.86799 Transcript_45393/m.86799 type:complete len:268 (+) Transcript_45393:875-1678(+)